MTASLPAEVQSVFERFVTTEYTMLDDNGQPITWPVRPSYTRGGPAIDVTTGDAPSNPHVAMLFSEPLGSGLDAPPMVLVQGCAKADADPLHVSVRPERVYVWRGGDVFAEPELFGAHMEEVRSGHSEEPEEGHAGPEGGGAVWDERIETLAAEHETAVLSFVAPDGFPFSVRVPLRVDPAATRIHVDADPVGAPLQPGLACLTAHARDPELAWQTSFQVRGDLRRDEAGWALEPHKVVGGERS
jgi:hypothetical protein